jgi:hypothetical protein
MSSRKLAACTLLACASVAVRAVDPAAAPPPAATGSELHIAHSALLSVEGTRTADSMLLHIRRVRDHSEVKADDVSVSVDGKNEAVTRDPDGNILIPVSELSGGGERAVELIVGHDGIRELLSGKVAVVEGGSGGSLLRDHKQIAWWILNIVIVLIAAIAISRRKG